MKNYRILKEWLDASGNKNNTVQNTDPRPGNLQRWFKLLGALTKYFKSRPELQNYRLVDTHIQSSRYGIMFYDDSKGEPPEGTTITFDMSSESFSVQEDSTDYKTNGKGFDNLIHELEVAAIPELAHFDFNSLKESAGTRFADDVKIYETLWEDTSDDPVLKVLDKYDDFGFDYEGFTEEWFRDEYDYMRGHYTVGGEYEYGNYTYNVEASEVFDDLVNFSVIENNADKHMDNDIVKEWHRLNTIWEESSDEDEDAATQALELYVANNLEKFVEIFYKELTEYYEEDAKEWASKYLEPIDWDPREDYEDD